MRKLQDTSDGEPPFPIKYYSVQPNRWTFQSKKIRDWVEGWLQGRVLNACAGKTQLEHDGEIVRNDIDPERDADYHYDVREIGDHFEANSFDTIVHDPPFSDNQAEQTDNGHAVSDTKLVMEHYDHLLRQGGIVIGFGFTTTLMPGEMDYRRREVAIFNTLGRQNDWLGTVDQRMSGDVTSYKEYPA